MIDINEIGYKKFRFSNKFYFDCWKNCGYDKNNIKVIAQIINEKVQELCGLISPESALIILQNEGKLL